MITTVRVGNFLLWRFFVFDVFLAPEDFNVNWALRDRIHVVGAE
jgi:hypothetical protein